MKFYRYLYGTDSMDSYREIQRSRHLDGFLFDRNITDQSETAIRNAREFFGGFSVMPGYEKYPKTERPVAIRYAPLYYDGLLRRGDIEPIFAFGVSAEENRGYEGKWAGPSTNRQTFFTQIDFFSAEQAIAEGEYTHLDVLFGIRPMTDEDVRRVRHGEARLDGMCTVDQMQPVLNAVDRNHVLAAAATLYQGKCVAIVLEEGVPFNRRARELLLNVYSLLQPLDAYRTGYSTYQNPKTIANVMNRWSVKVFVVPGDRNPENGVDPAQEIPGNVVVVDLRKPCAGGNTNLWNTLERWLDVPWKRRLQAMAGAMKGDNMLLARSDESENVFWRNEFLARSDAFFCGVDALVNWGRNADLSQLETLADVQRAYAENIEPWSSVPGADEVFLDALSREAQRRRDLKKRGEPVTLLDISRLTADAYADLMLNEDPTREQVLENLYQFGVGLTSPDPKTAWKRCESHQVSIRQKQVDNAVSQIREAYDARITGLEAKNAEYTRVKEALQLGEDADDVRVKEKISGAIQELQENIHNLEASNTELTEKNKVLDGHIASLYPGQAPGADHAARINELIVAEEIIGKCCQQLNMIGSSNQKIADRVGALLVSEQELRRCIEMLKTPADAELEPAERIQALVDAEALLNKCCEALSEMGEETSDPVEYINALKSKARELLEFNKTLQGHFYQLCRGEKQHELAFDKRIDALLYMEDAYLECQREVSTPDHPAPEPVEEIRKLVNEKKTLEDQNAVCSGYLDQLGIDPEIAPDQRITQLLDAEQTLSSCRMQLKIMPSDPNTRLKQRLENTIERSNHLVACADAIRVDRKHLLETKDHITRMYTDAEKCREQLKNRGYDGGTLYDGVARLSEDCEAFDELVGQVDTWAENGTAPNADWRGAMQHKVPEKMTADGDHSLRARISRFFVDLKRSWSTRKSHLVLSFVSGILATLIFAGCINLLINCFKPNPNSQLPHTPETTSPTTAPTTEPTTVPTTAPTTEPTNETTPNDSSSWITQEMVDNLNESSNIKTLIQSGLESLGETYGQVPLLLFSDREVAEGEEIPSCYVLVMTGEPQNTDDLYAYLTYGDRCIAVKHSSCTDHSLMLAIRLMTRIIELDNLNHDYVRFFVRLDKNDENEPLVEIQEPLRSNVESANGWLWEVTNCYTGNDTKKYSGTDNMRYRPLLVLEGEGWYMAYSDTDQINNDVSEQDTLKKLYGLNCASWDEFWYFFETKATE